MTRSKGAARKGRAAGSGTGGHDDGHERRERRNAARQRADGAGRTGHGRRSRLRRSHLRLDRLRGGRSSCRRRVRCSRSRRCCSCRSCCNRGDRRDGRDRCGRTRAGAVDGFEVVGVEFDGGTEDNHRRRRGGLGLRLGPWPQATARPTHLGAARHLCPCVRRGDSTAGLADCGCQTRRQICPTALAVAGARERLVRPTRAASQVNSCYPMKTKGKKPKEKKKTDCILRDVREREFKSRKPTARPRAELGLAHEVHQAQD